MSSPQERNQDGISRRTEKKPLPNKEYLKLVPREEIDEVFGYLTPEINKFKTDITEHYQSSMVYLSRVPAKVAAKCENLVANDPERKKRMERKYDEAYSKTFEQVLVKALKIFDVEDISDLPPAALGDIEQIALTSARSAGFISINGAYSELKNLPNIFSSQMRLYRLGTVRVRFWDIADEKGRRETLTFHIPIEVPPNSFQTLACIAADDKEAFFEHGWAQTCKHATPIKLNAPNRTIL